MIIPAPKFSQATSGTFQLSPSTSLHLSTTTPELIHLAGFLKSELQSRYGWSLTSSEQTNPNSSIILSLDSKNQIPESYELSIDSNQIRIDASHPSGLFYGLQSLFQLLPEISLSTSLIELAGIAVQDEPRFQWRGMHLDVSRHFFPIANIKKLLDELALHRLNRFHWHLTDDQGWRFESKRYPLLTEIGGWRIEPNGAKYGGFYTHEEMREVVQYATERYIEVVPEIDVPGHARALLAAYPEYSCTGTTQSVPNTWGIFDDVLCPGNESTFTFLTNLFEEVCSIFPSEFIHIGGDECPTIRWKECPDCQQRMRNEHIHSEHELQSYFTTRIAKMLSNFGKRAIGWDEILEGEIPSDTAIMSWRGFEGGLRAATAGHDVVMSPVSHCYFDYYQGPRETEPPAFPNELLLEKVYSFEPIPPELKENIHHHILGGQGNLWSEYMPSWEQVEYMAFPRMCALSEALWSHEKNYTDFLQRLNLHKNRLKRLHINFHPLPITHNYTSNCCYMR